MELHNKRILITGAGQGLGRAIALRLSELGACVLVTDLEGSRVTQVLGEIENPKKVGYQLDVSDVHQVNTILEEVMKDGGIDILINNAGLVIGGEFLKTPLSAHQKTLQVNVMGLWNMTHAFLPGILKKNSGAVVNIASASAILPLPHAATYAATKAAVLSFSDSLKEELKIMGNDTVRVSAICPSYISTGLFEGAAAPQFTRILTSDFVAKKVVDSIVKEKSFVLLPWTVWILYPLSSLLPRNVYHWFCRLIGVSTSMTQWKGHA